MARAICRWTTPRGLSRFMPVRERHENVDATANGRHIVWIPVHADNTPVACFELERSYPLTEQQVDVAKGIIALYRNFRALLEYSQQDTLTGLANRKTFDRSLAAFINSAQSAGKTSIERRASNSCDHWLAVIDIDHFKSVNDRFGHLYGDEVLILVANRMRDTFRQHDKLFRFGGEEFIVLLRHVNAAGAHATLDRFRNRIADEHFPQVGKVTVSIGFARVPTHNMPDAVLGSADEALYYAKGNGRNQICCYEELLEAGKLRKKSVFTDIELF
jgi:diguanylate cyclase (GGDEF)-like protein